MSKKSDLTVTETVRLSKRFTATLTMGVHGSLVEWSPRPADPAELTRQEMRHYRETRDRLLAQLGEIIGGNVALMETTPEIAAALQRELRDCVATTVTAHMEDRP